MREIRRRRRVSPKSSTLSGVEVSGINDEKRRPRLIQSDVRKIVPCKVVRKCFSAATLRIDQAPDNVA
jgi:hypothetical protein